MNFYSYPMQILLVIAKGCKPNSPYPDRAWMNLKPHGGVRIPELSRARLALVRAGLVIDATRDGWKVKPTPLGYIVVSKWKEHRRAMRDRPFLWSPVMREPLVVLDQRFDRWAA